MPRLQRFSPREFSCPGPPLPRHGFATPTSIPSAVKELRRVIKNYGMVGGILPAEGLPLPLGHPLYRPIFIEADRLDCALSVHSAPPSETTIAFYNPTNQATLAHVIPQNAAVHQYHFLRSDEQTEEAPARFSRSGLRLGAFSHQQNRGAPGTGETRRAPGDAQGAAGPEAIFLSMRRRKHHGGMWSCSGTIACWASDFPHEATRTNLKELVSEFFDRKDLPSTAKKKIACANPKHFYAL